MDKLFSFIVLGLVVLVPVAENAPTEDEILKCFETMSTKAELECCPETVFDYVDISANPCEKQNGTCDEATCQFKAIGIIQDGIINEDKALRVLKALATDKPVTKEMSERVQRYCFGETRYILYFEDEEFTKCGAMQLAFCSYVNSLIACVDTPLWKRTEECKEYSPEVRKCAKTILDAGLKEKKD